MTTSSPFNNSISSTKISKFFVFWVSSCEISLFFKRNEFRTFKLILWLFYNIESRKFLQGICSRFGYWKVTFWSWREGRDFFFLLVYFSFLLLIWLIQSSLPFQGILIYKSFQSLLLISYSTLLILFFFFFFFFSLSFFLHSIFSFFTFLWWNFWKRKEKENILFCSTKKFLVHILYYLQINSIHKFVCFFSSFYQTIETDGGKYFFLNPRLNARLNCFFF